MKPVWTMGAGQPDAGVVDGQHRSMSLCRGGRPDRIGSLVDGACPTCRNAGYREDRTLTGTDGEVALWSAPPDRRGLDPWSLCRLAARSASCKFTRSGMRVPASVAAVVAGLLMVGWAAPATAQSPTSEGRSGWYVGGGVGVNRGLGHQPA